LRRQRPAIGERLWFLFDSYFRFSLRLLLESPAGLVAAVATEWHAVDGKLDDALFTLLSGALEQEELEVVRGMKTKLGSLRRTLSVVEEKILGAIAFAKTPHRKKSAHELRRKQRR